MKGICQMGAMGIQIPEDLGKWMLCWHHSCYNQMVGFACSSLGSDTGQLRTKLAKFSIV